MIPKKTRYKKYENKYIEVDDYFAAKIRKAIVILNQIQSLPESFDQSSVQIYIDLDNLRDFTLVTENILIKNSYDQYLRFNEKNILEEWLILPISKKEGFYDEIAKEYYFVPKKDQQFIESFKKFIPVWKTADDEILEIGDQFYYFVPESNEINIETFDRYTNKNIFIPYFHKNELIKAIRVNYKKNLSKT